jgi:hypothetical protein
MKKVSFHVERYKSELLPLWIKNAEMAQEAAGAVCRHFLEYRDEADFVGMDVARKYLQVGYTWSRRYAGTRAQTRVHL